MSDLLLALEAGQLVFGVGRLETEFVTVETAIVASERSIAHCFRPAEC